MLKRLALSAIFSLLLSGAAWAGNCASIPYSFANGSTADAGQVNANFSYLGGCAAPANNPSFTGTASFTGGNVGIGITSPVRVLDVSNGLSTAPTGSQTGSMRVVGYQPSYELFNYAGTANWYFANNDANGNALYIGKGYGPAQGITPNISITQPGNVGIGNANPSYTLTVSGTAWVTSGAWSGSDRRWKKDIVPLKESLDKVSKLQGVNFNWRKDEFPEMHFTDGPQIGLIAQDTEKVLPEIVTTNNEGYKGISYEKLTPVLVEAIKEQQAEIEQLRASIEHASREIAQLKHGAKAGSAGSASAKPVSARHLAMRQ